MGSGSCWNKKAPVFKICHTYPTIMKVGTVIPYLKKIRKIYNYVTHLSSFADIRKSVVFAISRNTGIDCIFAHNF